MYGSLCKYVIITKTLAKIPDQGQAKSRAVHESFLFSFALTYFSVQLPPPPFFF